MTGVTGTVTLGTMLRRATQLSAPRVAQVTTAREGVMILSPAPRERCSPPTAGFWIRNVPHVVTASIPPRKGRAPVHFVPPVTPVLLPRQRRVIPATTQAPVRPPVRSARMATTTIFRHRRAANRARRAMNAQTQRWSRRCALPDRTALETRRLAWSVPLATSALARVIVQRCARTGHTLCPTGHTVSCAPLDSTASTRTR